MKNSTYVLNLTKGEGKILEDKLELRTVKGPEHLRIVNSATGIRESRRLRVQRTVRQRNLKHISN